MKQLTVSLPFVVSHTDKSELPCFQYALSALTNCTTLCDDSWLRISCTERLSAVFPFLFVMSLMTSPLCSSFSYSLLFDFISSICFSSLFLFPRVHASSYLSCLFPHLSLCLCAAGQAGSMGTGQPLVNAIRSDSALIGGTVTATCLAATGPLPSITGQKSSVKQTLAM